MRAEIKNLLRSDIHYTEASSNIAKPTNRIFLHQNENALGSPLSKWYNRYPDPDQREIKQSIAGIKGVAADNIFLGNGTAECLDVLLKTFCEPKKDNIIVCSPGMETVKLLAGILGVEVRTAILQDDFQPDLVLLENLADEHTKMLFLSSPNKISGIPVNQEDIEIILNNFNGLVVIDEAFVNFSKRPSFLKNLPEYQKLILLQTFSKAWGLAGLRLATAVGSKELISLLNQIKIPNNISQCQIDLFLQASSNVSEVNAMIKEIVAMRNAMEAIIKKLPVEIKVYPSEANFILIKLKEAQKLADYLLNSGIEVFFAGHLPLCENSLRITIGNEFENTKLVDSIFDFFLQK